MQPYLTVNPSTRYTCKAPVVHPLPYTCHTEIGHILHLFIDTYNIQDKLPSKCNVNLYL